MYKYAILLKHASFNLDNYKLQSIKIQVVITVNTGEYVITMEAYRIKKLERNIPI